MSLMIEHLAAFFDQRKWVARVKTLEIAFAKIKFEGHGKGHGQLKQHVSQIPAGW